MVLNFCSVPKRTTNFVTCEELITLVDFLLSYFRGDNLMEGREIFDTVAASGSVRLLLTNLKDDVKNITDIHVLLTRTFEIYSVSQYVFLNADVVFFYDFLPNLHSVLYILCKSRVSRRIQSESKILLSSVSALDGKQFIQCTHFFLAIEDHYVNKSML